MAGYTIILYDYLLTLDQELQYIWKAKWTLVKALYLLNRYGNLGVQTFFCMEQTGIFYSGVDSRGVQLCYRYHVLVVTSIFVANESVHILVLLRSWVLWGCERKVAIALLVLYLGYAVWSLFGIAQVAKVPPGRTYLYYGTIRQCVGHISGGAWWFWIGSLLIDTVFFLCMMYSLRKYEQISPYPTRLRRHLKLTAILFYVVCVGTTTFTILAWEYWGPLKHVDPRYFLTTTLSGPLLSITGQRLVLSLRSLQGQNLGVSMAELSQEVRRQLAEFENDDDGHEGEE